MLASDEEIGFGSKQGCLGVRSVIGPGDCTCQGVETRLHSTADRVLETDHDLVWHEI